MVKVINHHAGRRFTIEEVFTYCDNTCILDDGRIAVCAWMDARLFNKLAKEDFILCFIVDNDGDTNIEYIRTDTPATPCDVEITVG